VKQVAVSPDARGSGTNPKKKSKNPQKSPKIPKIPQNPPKIPPKNTKSPQRTLNLRKKYKAETETEILADSD
jgi:hypothetical protein